LGEKEQAVKSATWDLIESYLRETPIAPDEKPEAVEVGVEADLSGHGLPLLVGVIDLLRAGEHHCGGAHFDGLR
jgi:hypothetical protein